MWPSGSITSITHTHVSFYCLQSVLIHITLVTPCEIVILAFREQVFQKCVYISQVSLNFLTYPDSSLFSRSCPSCPFLKCGFRYRAQKCSEKSGNKVNRGTCWLLRCREGRNEGAESISFLWLPYWITTDWMVYINKNLFPHRSGDQKSEIKVFFLVGFGFFHRLWRRNSTLPLSKLLVVTGNP